MAKLRIKDIMAAQGVSVREIAGKMGVTSQYLGGVINGKGSPTVATLDKIAAVLGVPVSSLFEDFITDARSVAICPYCGGRVNIKTGKGI